MTEIVESKPVPTCTPAQWEEIKRLHGELCAAEDREYELAESHKEAKKRTESAQAALNAYIDQVSSGTLGLFEQAAKNPDGEQTGAAPEPAPTTDSAPAATPDDEQERLDEEDGRRIQAWKSISIEDFIQRAEISTRPANALRKLTTLEDLGDLYVMIASKTRTTWADDIKGMGKDGRLEVWNAVQRFIEPYGAKMP